MNTSRWIALIGLAGMAAASGCRTATQVAEVPRVDLELGGGNRGYLVGTPPAAPSLKTTRKMFQADIEIPSSYKPTHAAAPVDLGETTEAAPTEPAAPEARPAAPNESVRYDTYVVKPGDSLGSIAKHVYGKTSRWKRIYNANRDVLNSPNKVRAGMTLKIPRDSVNHESSISSDEGVTKFKK